MPDQKMNTAPNVTEMKGNMVINNFYIEEGNCVNVWKTIIWLKKKNTDPIPHFHPCTNIRIRITYGPKIGFIKESLFNFIKTHIWYQIDNQLWFKSDSLSPDWLLS